jgi:prepilin peptidase CpaA
MGWLALAVPKLLALATALRVGLLMAACWSDLASRLIPDRACLALGVVGAVVRLLAGPAALAQSLAAAAALFLLLFLLHARRIVGGGDVKLMAAVALGLPPLGTMRFVFATALAGGALALLHLAARHLPRPALAPAGASILRRLWIVERWRILRRAPLPYGVAIACGGAWTLLSQSGS